jgi:uncharacterized protein YlaI
MPIPEKLMNESIEFECPTCSHVMAKKGSWVKVIAAFNCDECNARIRIGYMTKLALFEQKSQSMRLS